MKMENCINCKTTVHVPDDKTGLIHTDGKYACYTTTKKDNGELKVIRLETVAEVSEV
jgi:hypothetical protein